MNLREARRRQTRRLGRSRVQSDDYFSFGGGLNLVDTPLKIKPGELLGSKNYEPNIRDGYARVDGYERVDGRTKASDASFTYMELASTTPANYPAVGNTVTGGTSGATGRVLLDVVASTVKSILSDSTFSAVSTGWFSGVTGEDALDSSFVVSPPSLSLTSTSSTGAIQWAISQRFPISYLKRYLAYVTAQEISGTHGQYLGIAFWDAAGNNINAALDSATGWLSKGSFFYFGRANQRFDAVETRYEIDFGANGSAQLPQDTVAASFSLVWLANYTGAGTAENKISNFVAGELNTAPAVVVGRVTGAFVDGETLTATGSFGTVDGDPLVRLAPNDEELSAYQKAASDDLRTLITAVPGEGSILGVVPFENTIYAFRNKTGGASAGMYRSSAAGWVEITPNQYIEFDDVVTQVLATEGGTLTGGTSGATATLERVGYNGGAVASDNATGRFTVSGVSGTFQNNEILTIGGANVGTANGVLQTVTLAPDGRYEFRIHNFYGHTNSRRLYGVDGKNNAFEYDNSGVFAQIDTGMAVDTPNHLGVHQKALWLGFPGGSAQVSGDADPLTWLVVVGAGEIAVGAEITGFLEEVGDTMFIMTEKRSYYITGRRGSYELDEYNFETGTKEWTVQRIGAGMYLDQISFSQLMAADKYGNFRYNSFSDKILPLVESLRKLAISSCVSRRKNLYRCFFSDTRFISIGVRGTKITGMTTCDYGIPVRCIESLQEGPDGEEMIVFGSDDGFVYEADSGVSFDGGEIEAFARVAFHYSKTPTRRKRYRQAAIDISTEGAATLAVSVDYTFASADEPGNPSRDVSADGGGGFWDISDWDEFKWSAGVVSTARFKLEGAGRNIGLLFYHNSDVEMSHSIEGLTLHHSARRIDRSTNA